MEDLFEGFDPSGTKTKHGIGGARRKRLSSRKSVRALHA